MEDPAHRPEPSAEDLRWDRILAWRVRLAADAASPSIAAEHQPDDVSVGARAVSWATAGAFVAMGTANNTRSGLHAGSPPVRWPCYAAAGGARLRWGHRNDLLTGRADQMPYGSLRDSGNTREGPVYAAHEMSETRSAAIS